MSAKKAASAEGEALKQLRLQLQAESSDGARLLNSPEDNPICSISVDESIPAVVAVWKRYATSLQLRFVHEHILQLLAKHHIDRILGDDTALTTIHSEDQAWIVQDWMPRAVAIGLKAAASKSPEAYFGRLAVSGVRSGAPEGIVIRVFDRMAAARQWLRDFKS